MIGEETLNEERVVLDTNVVLSGLLFAGSVPAHALLKAQRGVVLSSDATRLELIHVMSRSRFDRYVEREFRQRLTAQYVNATESIDISVSIRACRDPRDDKFLEVAVHGRANAIVTGDSDLLALHPFRGIEILSPADYLARKYAPEPFAIPGCNPGAISLSSRTCAQAIPAQSIAPRLLILGAGRTGKVFWNTDASKYEADPAQAGWQKRWETRERWHLARILRRRAPRSRRRCIRCLKQSIS
jgi:putative PIN family toxin of toxin-antitoxin system